MSTTFEKFVGQRAGNYSTMPDKDVPILPDVHVCASCRSPLTRASDGPAWGLVKWEHSGPNECADTYIRPATRCRFCHSQDAVYRQHAWYDAVECDRCGGVSGYAIGD